MSTTTIVNNPEYINTLKETYSDLYKQLQDLYKEGVKELIDLYGQEGLSANQIIKFYNQKQIENSSQFYKNIYIGIDNNKLATINSLIEQAKNIEEQLSTVNAEQVANDIKTELKRQEINDLIEATSDAILNEKLDEILNSKVQNILSKHNYSTEDCLTEIKNYIWSFNNATQINEKEIDKLKKEIESSLYKSLNNLSQKALYSAKNGTQNIVPNFDSEIDEAKDYLNEIKKLDIQQNILNEIKNNVKNGLDNIDDSVNSVLNKLGLKIDLSGTFSDEVTTFSKHLTDTISEFLNPVIETQNNIIQTVANELKQYETLINQYEKQVQDLIKKYEDTAQQYIKEQETKLVNNIISSINIKF